LPLIRIKRMDLTKSQPTDAAGPTREALRAMLRLAAPLLLLAPFVVYSGLVLRHACNLPFVDDYAVVLGFLSRLREGSGWLQSLDLFWHQHNEHRILLTRLVAVIQSQLAGSVNFRILIVLGNLGWLGSAFLLCHAARRRLQLPWAALVPVPALLLTPVHYESML